MSRGGSRPPRIPRVAQTTSKVQRKASRAPVVPTSLILLGLVASSAAVAPSWLSGCTCPAAEPPPALAVEDKPPPFVRALVSLAVYIRPVPPDAENGVDRLCRLNTRHFLDHVADNATTDVVITVIGDSLEPEIPAAARLLGSVELRRDRCNLGADLFAHARLIGNLHEERRLGRYSHFVFTNCGVRGPLMRDAASCPQAYATWRPPPAGPPQWLHPFAVRLGGPTKTALVGPSVAYLFAPHVQTHFVVVSAQHLHIVHDVWRPAPRTECSAADITEPPSPRSLADAANASAALTVPSRKQLAASPCGRLFSLARASCSGPVYGRRSLQVRGMDNDEQPWLALHEGGRVTAGGGMTSGVANVTERHGVPFTIIGEREIGLSLRFLSSGLNIQSLIKDEQEWDYRGPCGCGLRMPGIRRKVGGNPAVRRARALLTMNPSRAQATHGSGLNPWHMMFFKFGGNVPLAPLHHLCMDPALTPESIAACAEFSGQCKPPRQG